MLKFCLISFFREELIKLGSDQREIDCIFSNIMDLYELTYTLSGSLEDVIEMAQDQMPYIGSCFEGKFVDSVSLCVIITLNVFRTCRS